MLLCNAVLLSEICCLKMATTNTVKLYVFLYLNYRKYLLKCSVFHSALYVEKKNWWIAIEISL